MGLRDHRVLMCAVAFFYIADVAAGSAEAGERPDVFRRKIVQRNCAQRRAVLYAESLEPLVEPRGLTWLDKGSKVKPLAGPCPTRPNSPR